MCSTYDKIFLIEYIHESTGETITKLKSFKFELELEFKQLFKILNEYSEYVNHFSNNLIDKNIKDLKSNLKIPTIKFAEPELGAIAEVLSRSKGPKGPVYYLERYNDEHRNIMHTNNN